MAIDNNFNYKLKLACSQLGLAWIKDAAKSSEEKAWAKSNLINVNGQLDEYLTVAGSSLGLDKDTEFEEFKSGIASLLPDAFLAYSTGATLPTPSNPNPVLPYITRLAFRSRLTNEEKVAVYTAAETNVQLKVFLDDLAAATYVDLTRPDTIAGVTFLETAGLLATGRAAEILNTETITDIERWNG